MHQVLAARGENPGVSISVQSSLPSLSSKRLFFTFLIIAGSLFWIKYLILMNGSVVYGRLAAPPDYDDVTYFADALERVRIFRDDGLWAVARDFYDDPPHSPYSIIGAFLAFLVDTSNRAAPYAINALALATIAASFATAFRWEIGYGVIFLVFLASLPWFDQAITVFHPDLISGFAIGAVSVILLWQDQVVTSKRRAALVGAALGASLLIKPTTLPFAAVMLAVSSASGVVVARLAEGHWREVLRRLSMIVAVALLIAGPYYAVSLATLIKYIYAALIADSDIWAYRGSSSEQALYYILAVGENLLYWGAAAVVLIVCEIIRNVLTQRWREALRTGALALVIFVSYLIPTVASDKSDIYGGTLYAVLILSLGLMVFEIVVSFEGLKRRVMMLVAPGLLLTAASVQMSDWQIRLPPQDSLQATAIYDQVFAIAKAGSRALMLAGKPGEISLYVPYPGPVAPHAFRYRALVEGVELTLIDKGDSIRQTDLDVIHETANRANLILVPDDAAIEADTAEFGGMFQFRINRVFPQFRAWLAENPGFSEIGHFPFGGGQVLLYRSVSK
jgi:hypothetical protein